MSESEPPPNGSSAPSQADNASVATDRVEAAELPIEERRTTLDSFADAFASRLGLTQSTTSMFKDVLHAGTTHTERTQREQSWVLTSLTKDHPLRSTGTSAPESVEDAYRTVRDEHQTTGERTEFSLAQKAFITERMTSFIDDLAADQQRLEAAENAARQIVSFEHLAIPAEDEGFSED